MSLTLAVDNTKPEKPEKPEEPEPDYREFVAAGRCQECRYEGPGVTVAGVRFPANTWFAKIALCEMCGVMIPVDGKIKVMALVPDGEPRWKNPLGKPEPAREPDIVPEPAREPDVPLEREGFPARFPGTCPSCRGPIAAGQLIKRGPANGKWIHARCPALDG